MPARALAKQTALDQYQALVADLEDTADAQITRQIEISLIGDSDFAASQASDPTAAMLARLNIVEGIFSEQVGLLVLATDVRVMPADSDPFTSTKGTTLLEQLGTYRAATAAVRARGLAHLMTGKDLDGTTAGIAYVDTVCDVDRGVSLSAQLLRHHDLRAHHGARAGPQLRRAARRRGRRCLRGHRAAASSCRRRSAASPRSPIAAWRSCSRRSRRRAA